MLLNGDFPPKGAKLDFNHWLKPVVGLLGSDGIVHSKYSKRMVKQTNANASVPRKTSFNKLPGWKVGGASGLDIGLSAELGTNNNQFIAKFVVTPISLTNGLTLLSTRYNTSLNWNSLDLSIGTDGHPDFSITGVGAIYNGTGGPALQIGKTSCVIFTWSITAGIGVYVDGRLHGTAGSQGYALPTYTQCVIGKLATDHTTRSDFILHEFSYSRGVAFANGPALLLDKKLAKLSANPWENWKKPSVAAKAVASGGDITGTLAATETGADVAAFAGNIYVSGQLAVAEVGADIAAFSGTTVITTSGALAAVETGVDSAAFAGNVYVSGALAASEAGSDSATFSGNVYVSGSLAATEVGSDIAAFAGDASNAVVGVLAATETGSDTAAFVGDVYIAGSLSATEVGSDVAAFGGAVQVKGQFAATETGLDIAAFSGTAAPAITGILAAVETGLDIAAFSGLPPASGLAGGGGGGRGRSTAGDWEADWKRKKEFEGLFDDIGVIKPVADIDPVTEEVVFRPPTKAKEVAERLAPKAKIPKVVDDEEEELLLLLM